jgi:hypothetical protein
MMWDVEAMPSMTAPARWAVGALLTVAACAAPVPTAVPRPSPPAASPTSSEREIVPPSASTSATTPVASPVAPTPVPDASGTGIFPIALAAVQDAAGDVALHLVSDVTAGAASLDGTADDGDGPGRLLVVISPAGTTAPGNLCLDPDFVQGGSCARERLSSGARLYRRGLVRFGDTRTIVVVIQRADGSGVLVESDNFLVPTPPELVAGQPHPTPIITRSSPVFTLDELVRIASSVSAATEGCSIGRCP